MARMIWMGAAHPDHPRHPRLIFQFSSGMLPPYVVRKSHSCQRANHIPSDVDLPPMTAEACGRRLRMVIAVPVFTPRCHLKRAQPPDVLAGIDTLRKARLKMQ